MLTPTLRDSLHLLWLTFLSLALSACGTRPPTPERTWLDFTDQVWFQRGNVTTDLISAPGQIGLENLGYGWRRVHAEDPERATFEMDVAAARIFFFSTDGDTAAIELEISVVGKGRLKQTPLTLTLNDKPLGTLPLTRDWQRHRLEISGQTVRRGRNRLDFSIPQPKKYQKWRQRLRPRVRNVHFFAANGRGVWSQRPTHIRLVSDSSSTSDHQTIEMPSPSRIEVVSGLPERGRLRARFQVDRPPGADEEPVLVYARLQDPTLAEHHLAQERVAGSDRTHDFDVDLSEWGGQSVRLQLGVGGTGNAVVSWHWAVVEAAATRPRPVDIELIQKRPAPVSGRLGQPDVLVVLLDAARADAFSPFGAERPTPSTARLASDGTVFLEAMAASSWTGQSIPSIFTGFYPDTLRVGPWGSPLPTSIDTVAELLSRIGYRTVLWTQHPFYRYQKDLKRGFQEFYRSEDGNYRELPSRERLISGEQPTFAFVHLVPPHDPYSPPPPHRGLYSSWYTGSIEPVATLLRSFPDRRPIEQLTEEDRRFIRDRYDENVAFADAQVGALLSMLDSAGRYEDTLVILTSDHGEAFLEHGLFLHSRELFREFLHVPLVIKWPGGVLDFETRVAQPVSLVDLVPTLLDGLALQGQRDGFQGRSLIPVVFDRADRPEPLWATTRRVDTYQKPPRPLEMLQAGPWKIQHDPLSDRSRIYQIEADPAENRELSQEMPMQALYLRQALQRQSLFNRGLLQQEPEPETFEDPDTEVEEQLEALGYIN